jgi:hypothetical protein
MNGDRAFGITREQIRGQLALDDSGEPRERMDPPEPDNYCAVCGWTGLAGGRCGCDDGVPRC